jgi:hypothetical protein
MVYKKEILEFGDFSEQILTGKVKNFIFQLSAFSLQLSDKNILSLD